MFKFFEGYFLLIHTSENIQMIFGKSHGKFYIGCYIIYNKNDDDEYVNDND